VNELTLKPIWILKILHSNVHVPNVHKIEVKTLNKEMKKSVLTTQHNPTKIIGNNSVVKCDSIKAVSQMLKKP